MPFRDSYLRCYCGAELSLRKSRVYSVRECAQCGGKWVPVHDLQNMLQLMEPSHQPAKEIAELLMDIGESERACLACGEGMRLAFLQREKIDICKNHGVWFDHPELSAMLQQYIDRETR